VVILKHGFFGVGIYIICKEISFRDTGFSTGNIKLLKSLGLVKIDLIV